MGFFGNLFKRWSKKRKIDEKKDDRQKIVQEIPEWEKAQLKQLPHEPPVKIESTQNQRTQEPPVKVDAPTSQKARQSVSQSQTQHTQPTAPPTVTEQRTQTAAPKKPSVQESATPTRTVDAKKTTPRPAEKIAEPTAARPKKAQTAKADRPATPPPTSEQTTPENAQGSKPQTLEDDPLIRIADSVDAAKNAAQKAASHLRTAKSLLELSEEEAEKLQAESKTVEVRGVPKGKFEIKKARDGRYVFNLFASNYSIVATSQIYTSAQSALNGIQSVIANAERAGIEDQTLKNYQTVPFPKWEIYTDRGGAYRFRLNAPNGSCICHSQGYTTKNSCKNGIESIIRNCKSAGVDKAYLKKDDKT